MAGWRLGGEHPQPSIGPDARLLVEQAMRRGARPRPLDTLLNAV